MRRTVLYEEHISLGGKVVDFHGWALPLQFSGILHEHEHTRTKASLFDCSHMGEFLIRGAEAIRQFDALVCCDIVGLPTGRGRYGAMLTERGGIIDDVISFRLAPEELLVVTNAGPLECVSQRITSHVDGAQDISDATAKIDVQGPLAREIIASAGLADATALRYFGVRRLTWEGHELIVSRAGYTGELGYELFVPVAAAVPLWRALLAHEDAAPAGLGARDTLRTEMGYPLSGQDMDETRTPIEAGGDRFIAWESSFVGREALVAQRERGGYLVLTGIRAPDRRSPRPGFEVFRGDEAVGVTASGTYGPSVGFGVGLAYLPPEMAVPGTALTAGPKRIPVEAAALPFYTHGTCRMV